MQLQIASLFASAGKQTLVGRRRDYSCQALPAAAPEYSFGSIEPSAPAQSDTARLACLSSIACCFWPSDNCIKLVLHLRPAAAAASSCCLWIEGVADLRGAVRIKQPKVDFTGHVY
jgi:hypothetical protein